MKVSKLIVLLSFLFSTFLVRAQNDSTTVEVGKLYLSPLPVIAYGPAHGWVFGGAVSGGVFLGNPSTTNMSNALVTGTYTTKNQLMFTIRSNVYTNENKWFLMGDWRLFFSSQPTYGLGTGSQADNLSAIAGNFSDNEDISEGELMEFDLIRFHQTALKQFMPGLYAGIGYHLDIYSDINDQMLNLESNPPNITNHYTYSIKHGFNSKEYTTSGISLSTAYDTRDNVANPYSGRFAYASYRVLPTFLGSTKNATSLWLEYRDYFNISKKTPRNLLAFWAYGSFTTSGTLPYMSLPALGWDQMGRSGRAYAQGRFRGHNLCYAEAEWRFPLPVFSSNTDLLGGVLFANMTSASNEDKGVDLFQYIEPAAGVGLRIMIQKQSRANLTIDYGWGANGAGAFYLNINEYF